MSMAQNSFQPVTCHLPSKAFNGYTLFAPVGGSGVWLMDMKGRFVHHWEVDPEPGGHGVLLSDGNLLYGGSLVDPPIPSTGPVGGKLIELDWEGSRIWEHEDPYMHHDFCRLPNGNTLICEGSNGRFFEVTLEKELVWEYINPFYFKFSPPSVLEWNNTVFRAYRYSPDYPGLKGKALDPERYELTLQERKSWQEKVVHERIRRLGY